ncbi:methyl-accepting chemotaxis protein [Rhodoferax saidenbachensis]|uniref:Methyl-accepting chemotaxis protein n=1 Tax=Rhodoferax saidenbachensis TaxID=1484693 RepID=A0ABU1ZSB7_9BURK|nr:methyl-accepting chemotaxis protein [Rhodoferax saidenbachensis]MDR7308447.1 methyl-accepting chemotaxis protein [Rhodoferax saidenbachensis]
MKLGKVFSAGMWVMRNMRFGTKLGALSAVLLLPMLLIVWQLLAREVGDMEIARAELEGIVVVDGTSELVRQIQIHRGQSNMVLAGNTGVQAGREKTREALRAARDSLDKKLGAITTFDAPTAWPELRSRIDGLVPALEGKGAPESFAIHTALIEDLGRFVYGVADSSSLLYDPDPLTYLLMDTVVSRVIPWTEKVGQLRGLGSGLLSQPTLDEAGAARVRAQVDALDVWVRDAQYSQGLMAKFNYKDPTATQAQTATTEFTRVTRERFAAGAALSDSQTYFAAGTQTIGEVAKFQRSAITGLQEQLQARLDAVTRMLWMTALGSGVAVLLVVYFTLAFNMSFAADLKEVLEFMTQTANGNLRHKAKVLGKDELSQMAVALQAMVTNVSVMVASVRSNAALVSHAGESLVRGNEALSGRTEQQAANLEQTAASVEELSSTVDGNAQVAQQSDSTTQRVRETAEEGARGMVQAIASVEAIEASTKRMDEIVGVIDGLAFQTNILALNAAVEAARAGESGRGFAVVASEVRSLAGRSAESAKEIRKLITSSSAQVATGVAQIRAAGENINRIVEGVRGVAANMSQISASSVEQSSSLAEITAAVRQLDEITQQNATMVERAVAQSTDLQVRASTLSQAVDVFKLQQGTTDEAHELVDRAIALRQRSGSRDAFVRQVTPKESGLFDRDMYVFVLDAKGTYLAFGGNPAKVGTRVQDVAGIDGDALIASIIRQASQDPGWVEYEITNPATGKVQTKLSYVQQVDDVYVGCGVYKNLVTT